MDLTEENHIEIINSYEIKDWQPLFDLIPKIQSIAKFGEDARTLEEMDEGAIVNPQYNEHSIVNEFCEDFLLVRFGGRVCLVGMNDWMNVRFLNKQ